MITNRKHESGVSLTISLGKEAGHYLTWEQRVTGYGEIVDIGYFVIGAGYPTDRITDTKRKSRAYDCRYGMINKMKKYRKEWLERKEVE